MENKVIIYQTPDGQTQLDVRLEKETVWLTQAQMAELFQTDRTSIVRHINNIYKSEELDPKSTCAKIAQVQTEGKRQVTRLIPYFDLDMIISVGYRVNSKRGVQFRQWANRVLKQYLIKGYAVNEHIRQEQISELRQLVQVVGRTLQSKEIANTVESQDLLNVVVDYTYALDTLDNYDYQRLNIEKTTTDEPFHATYENAMREINMLKQKFGHSALFGNEKDGSFKALSARFTRLSMARIYTHQLRKRQQCYFIWLPKTIRLVTATNVLRPHCSYGFSMATIYFIIPMEASALQTIHL